MTATDAVRRVLKQEWARRKENMALFYVEVCRLGGKAYHPGTVARLWYRFSQQGAMA